jgi:hypothetical protein
MEDNMTPIPENTVTQADMDEWYALQKQLAAVKSAEMLLRMKIFKHYFPAPVEGTNQVPLGTRDRRKTRSCGLTLAF